MRQCIKSLTPYSTARDEYKGEVGVFLDANESPFDNGYNRYPDPHQHCLKQMLVLKKGIPEENIFIGNGSDEAIDLIFRVFCEPRIDNVISIAPSYGMYRVAAAINDVEMREVQLGENFTLPVDMMLECADDATKVMFICSPNNPTGNAFPHREILRLADRFNGIVVVDEAYIDFSDMPSLTNEISQHPNIVVLQTLSKAWGMAGLRLGIALADAQIIDIMSKVKYPYNINVATTRIAGQLLLNDVTDHVEEIKAQRAEVARKLSAVKTVRHIYPSDANFLLVRFDNPDEVYDYLISKGIIVRNRSRVRGCDGCLRITIGTIEENMKLIEALKEYER